MHVALNAYYYAKDFHCLGIEATSWIKQVVNKMDQSFSKDPLGGFEWIKTVSPPPPSVYLLCIRRSVSSSCQWFSWTLRRPRTPYFPPPRLTESFPGTTACVSDPLWSGSRRICSASTSPQLLDAFLYGPPPHCNDPGGRQPVAFLATRRPSPVCMTSLWGGLHDPTRRGLAVWSWNESSVSPSFAPSSLSSSFLKYLRSVY